MASPRKLLASAAIAAGLLGGGVVGVILGAPGVSGAQTTTVPDSPTTTAPAPDSGTPDADRPARGTRENCPEKDGAADDGTTEGSGTNTGLRRSGPGRV